MVKHPAVLSVTHDVEVASPVSAVAGSHDVLVRDKGATTEPGIVNKESNLGTATEHL